MKEILLSAVLLASLGGCVPTEKLPGSGGTVIQIEQGTVGVYEGLKIGVTNLVESEYTDAAGVKKKGLMAVLTLLLDGNPPVEKDVHLHPGQEAVIGKYTVYEEEIQGTTRGHITLRVR